ncbi:MAG TPA: hypothetical protein VM432_05055 [Bdellovibrionales bacterium]|nr:hypothetical protein [Bdellovibrionales bacterium]
MRAGFSTALLFSLLLIAQGSWGQVDPSSALLLNSTGDASVRETGIGSGRYTVRPKNEAKKDSSRGIRSETEPTPVATPAPAATAQPAPQAPKPPQAVAPQKPAPPELTAPQTIPPQVSAPQAPAEAVAAQQATPEARRRVLMEISVAPGYLYNASESSYSYRNYNTSAPTIAAEARVWFNPSIAVQTSYLGTLSSSVSDSRDGSRSVAAAQQWFTAGLRARGFVGVSRMAPSLSAGIDYMEYEFRAPSDAQTRAKLKSSGIRVSVDADVPANPYRSWTLGFSVAPKLQHRESKTEIDFQSGGNVDATQVGMSLGTNIRFDATSMMFLKLSHVVEKDLFSGPATLADPVTGVAPSGVSVTNSFTMIQLGYTWGN